jgi:hypothetical protein
MSAMMHEMLQDRMPEVARGAGAWDAVDLAHLASCTDCGAEWDLVRAAAGIGAAVERDHAAAATAQVVIARLRRERPLHRRPMVHALVGLAAAAAVVLVLGRGPAPVPVSPVPTDVRLLPELDSLNADELTLIADGLETPLSETPIGAPRDLDALDSAQLARVLHSLEG